ncbi:MAG: alpha-E domain-containing protein [Pseudomonadota bacterium]
MLDLLARFAENSYWMARYMERAENLARTLDVNETFAQNSEGVNEWLPIVQLYADGERFFENHGEANADEVLDFYILDRANPNSVISTVFMARENARSLRHLISTETWSQLNVFYNRLLKLQPQDLDLSQLSQLCSSIKEDCQLHTGIIEGTGYHDQAWYFYQIGKYLERMDQTTRLLDINYHRLLPSLQQVGGEIDASRWNAVLRSVAGYHAFRRVHPRGMSPSTVAGFLLFDPYFQRSVAVCVEVVDEMFTRLSSLVASSEIGRVEQTLATLRIIGKETSIEQVIVGGLHEFLDHIQQHIISLNDELADTLFGHRYERATASQHQS